MYQRRRQKFPYNLSPLLGLNGYLANTVDILFYLLKLFIVIIFSITLIRVGVARLKIDQVVYTYWIPLTMRFSMVPELLKQLFKKPFTNKFPAKYAPPSTKGCTFCAQCTDVCPVNALSMSDEFLLANEDKLAKELIIE